jgi:hypothetical protein
MVLRKVLALIGPNVWGRFPVLEAWVDLGDETELSPSEWVELKERWTRMGP